MGRKNMVYPYKDRTYPDLPDITDFYILAHETLCNLPQELQSKTDNLLVKVENFAEKETLFSLNIYDKYDLLGLYRGVPVSSKRKASKTQIHDTIFLYRCPLIRFARESREAIGQLVHNVIIHEVGHHLGFSDVDMDLIREGGV